jgi:uncharacterized protein YbaR (Trm112 family)
MNKRLLSILCCPVSHKGLNLARPNLLEKINMAISAGKLANRDGNILSESIKEALVTDDGKIIYPMSDGIPVLLEEESIELNQLD